MSSPRALQRYREAGLKPHQAKLLADFLDSQVPVRHLLVSPPGMGKFFAAMSLAKEIARQESGFRILVIGPAALVRMYEEELIRFLPRAQVATVTRRILRELEALARPGHSIWPEKFAAALSMDTARQEDVIARLCEGTWHLVIVAEVHLFTRSRSTLLKTILSEPQFERVLMSTATPDVRGISSSMKLVPRTEWHGPDLIDWEGRKLFATTAPAFESIGYRRSPDEVDLVRALFLLTKQIAPTRDGETVKKGLLRQAGSSWYALEQTIHRLRGSLVHGATEKFFLGGTSGVWDDGDAGLEGSVETSTALMALRRPWLAERDALRALDRVLGRLEVISIDTKREALEDLLRRLHSGTQPCSHICVFCTAFATANYLYTAVLDRGNRTWLLGWASTSDESLQSLEGFREAGGVLVTTTARLLGIDLRHVQVLIHYDVPTSPAELAVRLSRSPGATNFALIDQSGVLPDEWDGIGVPRFGEAG